MSAPGFWDDQAGAQSVIERLKVCKGMVEPHAELTEGVAACHELLEMVDDVDDPESTAELAEEVAALEKGYQELEIKLALSGPYDNCGIYMTIKPGAGGTDACDWAEMLQRMYVNYCQKRQMEQLRLAGA